jgi:hypothetical protein
MNRVDILRQLFEDEGDLHHDVLVLGLDLVPWAALSVGDLHAPHSKRASSGAPRARLRRVSGTFLQIALPPQSTGNSELPGDLVTWLPSTCPPVPRH